jgi:two-component system, NtrC family, nitrogen regulation sensor histidine kinase NtrY
MTLRSKVVLYFVALHVVLAAMALFVLMQNRLLLFVVEALFAVSVAISYRLVQSLFVPLDLIRTGAELISERDFSSRFVEVGQPEMDSLIGVYNRMIDRLHEERLTGEEQHQLLQKVIEASPSGIVICDFDGRIQQMNPAAQEIMTGELLDEIRTIQPGQSKLVAYAGPRRLKVWRAEFRDRGFPKTFFLIEELTEELRLSEKAAYEKLIRMMSHEVNNSVGAVRSLLDSSMRYAPQVGSADRDDFTSALTVASARMDSLNRFMSGFADVVRIPLPNRKQVRLAGLAARVAKLFQPELEARSIASRLDVGGDALASVDEHQFEQVLVNLFRNAIDAIGDGGEICVSLRNGVLIVADTGSGIPPGIAADVFTPFFTTRREGRGLGLTIVQEILTNHGFAYALRNRESGGAEFRIDLSPRLAEGCELPPRSHARYDARSALRASMNPRHAARSSFVGHCPSRSRSAALFSPRSPRVVACGWPWVAPSPAKK